MATTGASFYLNNVKVFTAGTDGTGIENTKILQAQASVLYRSRLSTKCAAKTIKSNTRFLSQEHERLKALIQQHELQTQAPQADVKPTDTPINTALKNANLSHAQEVECFMQEVSGLKIHKDMQARQYYADCVKKRNIETLRLAPLLNNIPCKNSSYSKTEDTPHTNASTTTRSGRVSKASKKRKALKTESATKEETPKVKKQKTTGGTAQSKKVIKLVFKKTPKPNFTYNCSEGPNCIHSKKSPSLSNHWGLAILEEKPAFEDARLRACKLRNLNLEYAARYYDCNNLHKDTFNLFPIAIQGCWIALRQQAARHGCATLPNHEAVDRLHAKQLSDLAADELETSRQELENIRLAEKGIQDSIVLTKAEETTEERRSRLLDFGDEFWIRWATSVPEGLSYAQRWKAEHANPCLADSEVLAIRRKFIFRYMDFRKEPETGAEDGELWNENEIVAILAGHARTEEQKEISYGFNAFKKATKCFEQMEKLIACIRTLEAARIQHISNVNDKEQPVQAPTPSPSPRPNSKFDVQPLRAIPHHMRALMGKTLTPIKERFSINERTGKAIIDDKRLNNIKHDKNNNKFRVFGLNQNMIRCGTGDWSLGTIYDFTKAGMDGKKGPELKRSSNLNPSQLVEDRMDVDVD